MIAANLPNAYWHDENNYVETALRFGSGNFKPLTFQHGMLIPLMLLGEYGVYYMIKALACIYHAPSDLLREYIVNPTAFYLIPRLTVLLFGVACIFLVYRIALKLYNRPIANISSLLFSVSLGPFIQSKWTKEDLVSTFFLLAGFSVCASLLAGRDPGRKLKSAYYALAGFLVGLAAAAKLSSVFGFVFIIAVHLLARKPDGPGGRLRVYGARLFDGSLLLSGLFFIAGFIAGNPYIVIDPRFFYTDVTTLSSQMFDPKCAPWAAYFTDHLNDVLGGRSIEALVLTSCLFFIVRRSRKEMALLAYPVTFYLFYMSYPGFAHYLIPVVPFLIILTGAFVGEVSKRMSRPAVIFLYAAVIVIGMVPPLFNMIRYNALIARPDTRTLAADWIEKNIPENSAILSEGYISTAAIHVPQIKGNLATLDRDLALIKSSGGSGLSVQEEIGYARQDRRIKRYDIYKACVLDAGRLEKVRPDYVILSGYNDMDTAQREYLRGDDFYRARRALYAKLAREYRLVKTFTPYPEFSFFFPMLLVGDFKKLEAIDPAADASRLLQGPEIRVYKAGPKGR